MMILFAHTYMQYVIYNFAIINISDDIICAYLYVIRYL